MRACKTLSRDGFRRKEDEERPGPECFACYFACRAHIMPFEVNKKLSEQSKRDAQRHSFRGGG